MNICTKLNEYCSMNFNRKVYCLIIRNEIFARCKACSSSTKSIIHKLISVESIFYR